MNEFELEKMDARGELFDRLIDVLQEAEHDSPLDTADINAVVFEVLRVTTSVMTKERAEFVENTDVDVLPMVTIQDVLDED
ncbi:hypothetical protein SEA_MINIFLAYER_23 [Satellite phage MiniFlayer]|nr:hypothetical protein SEA_MINIFLAYER_23 [Satellite phage MiniFlayer]